MASKILLIEDEHHIAEGIRINLQLAGHDVEVATDGQEGHDKWVSFCPDLIILDIMMPKIDGLSLLKMIRAKDINTPVLILSAKDSIEDRIEGLKREADDYLAKPFHLKELLLRMERLLARSKQVDLMPIKNIITFGDNTIEISSLEAKRGEETFYLTEQEGKLFNYLYKKEGQYITRETLLQEVWKYESSVNSRTVDNFIARFRKYFEKDPKNPQHFHSKRMRGYMFKS